MPFADSPTTEELAQLILAWAKEHQPKPYEETIKVAGKPEVFRRYLIRLVEIRCEKDRKWMMTLPVEVLEETRVTIRVKSIITGTILSISGKGVSPRSHTFAEMSLSKAEWNQLELLKVTLDLEPMEITRETPSL